MRAYIIIATKGRARETRVLLDYLQRQSLPPAYTVIAGTEEKDIAGLAGHPLLDNGRGEVFVSPRVGSSCQRNVGLETLAQRGLFDADGATGGERFFCAFFDDDFRPGVDWLKNAAARFDKGDIVGLTGRVLADGVTVGGYDEAQAAAFLDGTAPPAAHWANIDAEQETDCAYGCNMAFADTAVRQFRFDENLPLYGWQEDRDYTGQCLKIGRVVRVPSCAGVHMGVSGGRTSGLRFGYSQIANPVYLMRKGTMSVKSALTHMAKNLAANIAKTVFPVRPDIDYAGRLRGNARAFIDLLRGACDPRRILGKGF
ncbi:MAG: glycosyltransferase family 2 protein [Alphaproteobacteria bacterium]|nr:glycosyltransferase family 2 protein [Alphaproteobacteria bacterium]